MNLSTRRVLLTIFTLIFLVAAPTILLYSSGYRFDIASFSFKETGTLVLRSLPKDSIIEIDGKIHKEKTPSVISRLIPGTHTVKISTQEYIPWEKTIFIGARMTTFAENIQLFPSIVQEQTIASSDEELFISPHSLLAAKITSVKNTQQLFLIDLSDKDKPQTHEEPFLILPEKEKIENLTWSNNDKKILLHTSTSVYVLTPERNNEKISLLQKFKFIADRYEWHPTDDNIILAADKNTLWKLNIVLEEKEEIISDAIFQKNLSIRGNDLFIPVLVSEFLKQYPPKKIVPAADPEGWYLVRFNLKNIDEEPEVIRDLPVFTATSELHVTKTYVSVYIPQQKRWYLMLREEPKTDEPSDSVFVFQADNIQLLTWNGDFTKAVYLSNNNLWFADLGFDTFVPPVTLIKADSKATSLRWMPGDWHILVTTPYAIDVVEADLHTEPLSHRIIERGKKITPLEPLTNGSFLYVTVQDGGHPGAVRFSIFEEE
ncbi:MAG: PEGA domain-containing protein [Candidatus Jacksonbacteria bacterium]|jgi:hypothetical protein|nr:PEGA domain-containing protein [Candidatus Jacksonbacteria bacterium]MBT6034053.1 PEGA domain-containing protein [Candidatus Jacksonbacteria bacterium]MBT6301533.1 PEGA domain-containing protein [Candidatus Jacksonbacteria bacterium]MBT6757584.1 PEGA domain-containing protein [Candidatus Jacksonbacteria bacterium]MBT6955314.1 PEGA domain-containing protein [Candidatus Jacksonbacteria bacterium]